MTNSSRYRLHKSLGYILTVVARQQETRLDARLKSIGLTRISWCILLAVGNEDLAQPSEIAQFVGADRAAISRALRSMENNGIIRRQSGQPDGRTRKVFLTEKARDLIAKGTPFARENADNLAASLTKDECEDLRCLLAKLRHSDAPLLGRF